MLHEDINKKPLKKGDKIKVVKEIIYHGGTTVPIGFMGTVECLTDEDRDGERHVQVLGRISRHGKGFIISGNYLEKIEN